MNPLIRRLSALQLQAVLLTGSAANDAVQTIAEAISELQRLQNQSRAFVAAFNDLVDKMDSERKEMVGGTGERHIG